MTYTTILSWKTIFKMSLPIIFLCIGFPLFSQTPCLINQDAGINANLSSLDAQYNTQSPHTFRDMIAVNDGGNHFHSYTSSYSNPNGLPNPMLEVSDVVRYFVQMQEDFAVTPAVSQLPKETDGVPISMATSTVGGQFFLSNKSTLQGLKNQGFSVHACFEAISQTDGTYTNTRDFPEKWYFVDEWTDNPGINYAGVKLSVKNYTAAFINTMSPPGCTGNNCIVDVFEMGNEPWGYPDPAIYHAIITGAWEAFVQEYGTDRSQWKMQFIAPSFQAFRENILNCDNPTEVSAINLQTNPYRICQYDEIGEYLGLPCSVMDDISAVNIHPYGIKNGNVYTFKTEPEHPESEFNQIKNAVLWRDVNFKNVGKEMALYSTEFGWSSQPENANGNGELGQAAQLLRGILIQSRYHIDRTYIYNAYEDGNILFNWHSLYENGDSNGIGYSNSLGGRKKPAFFAVKDFRARFENKVFYRAIQEDRNGVYAYILTDEDGSDPYLVFWTPQETQDNNVNNLGSIVNVDWSNVFPNLGLESATATTFALANNPTNTTFTATNDPIIAGSANLRAKRMPAFIKLVPVGSGCGSSGNTTTGCGVTVEIDGLNVNFVSTTNTTNLIVKVRTSNWQFSTTLCNDYNGATACGSNSSVSVPSTGTYVVDVQIQGGSGCTFQINVDGSTGGGGTSYNLCSADATIEVCGNTITASSISSNVNSIKVQDPNTYAIVGVICVSWTSPTYQACSGSPSLTVSNGTYNIKVEKKFNAPQCLITNVQVPNTSNKVLDTSSSDNLKNYDYEIAPNPATNKTRLMLDKSWAKGPMEISIFNLYGQIVKRKEINYDGFQQVDLNLDNIETGIYMTTIVSLVNNHREAKRLIVQQ